MSRLSREESVGYIVKILKRKKSRPCFIERDKNVRCHLCKRKHDGFLIKDFDSENKVFTIVHANNDGALLEVVKQTPSEFQTFLLQCFQRKHFNLTKLLKKIDISEFKRTHIIKVRFLDDEEELLLMTAAKKKGVTVSEYIRSKLFGYQ